MTKSDSGYTDRCRAEFLHRSYTAVDGLWFVMVEDAHGFDRALELDREVWAVMPKIQARRARELLELHGDAPVDLARCIGLKFSADSQNAEISHDAHGVRVRLTACMWLDAMRRSGREHLASRVGEVICNTEFGVWAREFGGRYEVSIPRRLCDGCGCCEIVFALCHTNAEEKDEGGATR